MTRTRPDLIVPIRDRRQHRRFLTLKNFRNACFVLVALFAGIAIVANVRDSKPRDEFGRLVSRRMESPASLPKHPVVPATEPIADENAADPTLVQAAARSQILLDQPPTPVPQQAAVVPPQPTATDRDSPRVAIVGGPEGVTLVQRDARRPVLGGGFGRK